MSETTCRGDSNAQAKRTQPSGPQLRRVPTPPPLRAPPGGTPGPPLPRPATAVSRFSKHPRPRVSGSRAPCARADAAPAWSPADKSFSFTRWGSCLSAFRFQLRRGNLAPAGGKARGHTTAGLGRPPALRTRAADGAQDCAANGRRGAPCRGRVHRRLPWARRAPPQPDSDRHPEEQEAAARAQPAGSGAGGVRGLGRPPAAGRGARARRAANRTGTASLAGPARAGLATCGAHVVPRLPRPRAARPAPPARPGPPSPAPTCGPLSPGDDVLPEPLHRPVPGHLLVSRQALGQLDLGWELHARNHGERRGLPARRLPVFPPGARATSHDSAGLARAGARRHGARRFRWGAPDVILPRRPLRSRLHRPLAAGPRTAGVACGAVSVRSDARD